MKKLIVAIAALAMLTGSAYAAEWNFYGSARVSTFYESTDPGTGAADSDNLAVALQSNARIGANVKVSDELSGRFEYGGSSAAVTLRLLYGVWNFGAGTFLVGQDYTPIRLPYANSVKFTDNTMGGYGELASSRAGQLKLRFGGFQVAAVAPDTKYAGTAGTVENKMPQLAAKYIFTGDNYSVSVLGGYHSFKVTNESINSYVLGAGAKGTFGAFTASAQVHGGVNVGNLAAIQTSNAATSSTAAITSGYANRTAAGVIQDTEAVGFSIAAAYAVNDMFGLEAGYGYQETELDVANTQKDEVINYYLQAPITMAPGVFVVPEVGVRDFKEDGQEKETYIGAKWQINF